jgi:hypothetical protein
MTLCCRWLSIVRGISVAFRVAKERKNATFAARKVTMRNGLVLRHFACALTVFSAMGGSLAHAQDQSHSPEQRYVVGLRELGLLQIAERVCRRQLADANQEQDVWTNELLRVLAEQAMDARAQDRAAKWREAEKLADEFLRENKDHPRAVLVRVQLALNHFARGENLRIQSELAAGNVSPALTALAAADRAFKEIDEELAGSIGRAGTNRNGELTRDDLFALQNRVVYDRARVGQQRGLCYQAGSRDRSAAMGEALEFLKDGLKRLDPNAPLAYQMKLEQAICYRELADLPAAKKILASLVTLPVDDELIPAVRSELLRQAIALKDQVTVQRSLNDQDVRLANSPEWSLAKLQGAVFLWQTNKSNPRIAQRWRNDSLKTVADIEMEYGGYWARRANRTLIQSASGSSDVQVLQRRADEFYLRGQLAEALLAYDRAAKAAAEVQNPDAQFLALYRAARVVQEQDAPVEYHARLKKIADLLPEHPSSDDAHLVLIGELSTAARRDPKRLPEYHQALVRHLELWPAENTTDQVRVWLALWATSQGDDPGAIKLYRSVKPQTEPFADALDGLRKIWLRRLKLVPAETTDALKVFRSTIEQSDADPSSRPFAIAALSGAQLSLQYATANVAQWKKAIRLAWENCTDERLKAELLPIYAVTLAQSGQSEQASELIKKQTDEAQLLQTASQLADLVERTPGNSVGRQANGSLLLAVIDRLKDVPGAANGETIDLWEATAADISGDTPRAYVIYNRILTKTPANVAVRQKYARSLAGSKQKSDLAEAMNQWRIVAAAGLPKGDDSWFEARYEVARLYLKLGNQAEATKRVKLLLITSRPKEPWKSKLKALLEP